jgi:hypothetical protein
MFSQAKRKSTRQRGDKPNFVSSGGVGSFSQAAYVIAYSVHTPHATGCSSHDLAEYPVRSAARSATCLHSGSHELQDNGRSNVRCATHVTDMCLRDLADKRTATAPCPVTAWLYLASWDHSVSQYMCGTAVPGGHKSLPLVQRVDTGSHSLPAHLAQPQLNNPSTYPILNIMRLSTFLSIVVLATTAAATAIINE